MELYDEIIEENRRLKEQNQVLRDAAQKHDWGISYAIEGMIAKAGNRAVLQVLNIDTMKIEMVGIQINNDGTVTSPIAGGPAELRNEDDLDWDAAKKHLDFYAEEYGKLDPMAGLFGATCIATLRARYDKGERTRALYDDIMAVE